MAIKVFGLFASQALVEFRVVGSKSREIPIGAKHCVVVRKRLGHFLLVGCSAVFVLAHCVGDSNFREIG